jgi:hypothetical protein
MNIKNSKIGFSNIGGLFPGKDINSGFLWYYAISVIISFGKAFKITNADKNQNAYQAVLTQKNIEIRLETSKDEYIAFIHLVPYSDD